MATYSSILAWRIPWTEEPGGLQSTGHQESDMTERRSTHCLPDPRSVTWDLESPGSQTIRALCLAPQSIWQTSHFSRANVLTCQTLSCLARQVLSCSVPTEFFIMSLADCR